jgi:hypothetical protein
MLSNPDGTPVNLLNATGTTASNFANNFLSLLLDKHAPPYIDASSNSSLGVGQSVQFNLQFSSPPEKALQIEVLGGPGVR